MSEIDVRKAAEVANWDEMMAEATVIETPELVKDDDLKALVGVPLIVTRMTFRRGISRKGKANYSDEHPNDAYVSLECKLHPGPDLNRINSKRRQNDLEPIESIQKMLFEPGSVAVINNGGTGIYRQCVAYLAAREYITLPEDMPLSGEKGTTALDLSPAEWDGIHAGESTFDDDGFLCAEFPTVLAAKGGLQPSTYQWEDQDATTWYLA